MELVSRNTSRGHLKFTTSTAEAVRTAQLAQLAVGTPTRDDGSAELSHVFEAARQIAAAIDDFIVIVTKSSARSVDVPLGVVDAVERANERRKHVLGDRLVLIEQMRSAGAHVIGYAPAAMPNVRAQLGDALELAEDPYSAASNADALVGDRVARAPAARSESPAHDHAHPNAVRWAQRVVVVGGTPRRGRLFRDRATLKLLNSSGSNAMNFEPWRGD